MEYKWKIINDLLSLFKAPHGRWHQIFIKFMIWVKTQFALYASEWIKPSVTVIEFEREQWNNKLALFMSSKHHPFMLYWTINFNRTTQIRDLICRLRWQKCCNVIFEWSLCMRKAQTDQIINYNRVEQN